MEPKKTIINVGKYKFKITDNILFAREQIYCRNFKIGGNNLDCINVSISYDSKNEPISASIPHIMYDEECSIDLPLDRGEGSIKMIKALFQYIHLQLQLYFLVIFHLKEIEFVVIYHHQQKYY